MFLGSFIHSVDSKGRITIPGRFAARLGSECIVCRGLERCLWMFTRDNWEQVVRKLEPSSLVDTDAIRLQRYFVGCAASVNVDAQSRIAIPQILREFAGITREAVIIGAGTRIEIWSKERWDEFNETLSEDDILTLARKAGL